MDTEEEYFDVVISGISGKFPSCNSLEELKQKLLEKVNLVTQENCRWNPGEWNVPAATGQISVVKKFDDTFFGVHSGVAGMMDPLTRIAIERAYEAIMDAGINPKNLRGSRVAVFTNSCISDSEAIGCDEKLTAKFWLLAHVRALLANRISYVLHLQGPSWTLDSTWVGGIECLKHAVHDIKVGRVESALVGVSNVVLYPELSQHWMGLGKLSPDGTCHPFQDDANGYGRSEGVVFLYLQRANEANRIYATVSHVDTKFCGDKANTFLKPKQEALDDFFRKFYTDCPVSFDDIAYLEADGSAHKYLDEIELNSIGSVICNGRSDSLPVGCVKSNLGHTEGSSSLVSLSKLLICLDSGVIPPNLEFRNANKNIEKLQSGDMKIVTDAIKFPEGKFAAMNTIGLCTSVGHVLVKPHLKEKKLVLDRHEQIPRLVLISARNEQGILSTIDKLESMPYDAEYFAMINNVFKESTTGHFYRGFTILGATEKKIHFTLESAPAYKRPVWFVFDGMGSQWPGMGADLMHLPVFANTINELNSYLKPLGVDLIDILTNFDPTVLKNIVHSFVGISAIQIGMVDVLRSVGIEPDGMIGHSLGENGCAYADGCFTRYQSIMAAYFRGKSSSQTKVAKGLMAAVGLGHKQISDLPANVQIACHNSMDSTTISGPFDEVEPYLEELKKKNIFARAVNSNFVAYHSKQVKPLAPYVLENIRKIVPHPKKRSSRWISSSVLEQDWNSPAAQYSSAEYHVNNFLGTVYFAEACSYIPEEAIVIEISPHGLFQGILKRTIPESCFCLPLGKREISSPLNFLLSSIGKLYVVGLQPDVNAIYSPIEYPVSRGTPSLATLATWNHDNEWELNNYKDNSKIKSTEISLRKPSWRFLTGYKINSKILVPFATLLMETPQAYESNDPILIFDNVNIENNVEVTTNNNIFIHSQVHYGSGCFEIAYNNTVLINGTLRYSQENLSAEENSCENDFSDCITFTRNEIQEIFKQNSMEFSPIFSRITEIIFTDDGCRATLVWDDNLSFFLNTIAHVKMFYDLCTNAKGPLLPKFFLRLAIEVEKYATIHPGAMINIVYNKSTNIIKGSGIELMGLENTPELCLSNESRLIFQDLQFISHDNPQTKSAENFFNLCGQIIGEVFYSEIDHEKGNNPTPVNVTIAHDLNKEDLKVKLLLEMLYRELPPTQIDLTLCDTKYSKNGGKNKNEYKKYFIVCKNVDNIFDTLSQLAEDAEDIFLLSFEKVQQIPSQFIKITEENFSDFTFTLWKKKVPANDYVLKIMPHNEPNWLDDLEEELFGVTAQKSVVLQWKSNYIVDIVDVINQINALGPVHSLRYLVTMDEKISDNAEDSQFYQNQMQKGLTMNVFKNGTWGSIRHLSVASTSSTPSHVHRFAMKTKRVKNIDVEYISLHRSYSQRYSFDDEVFEFSGVTDDKRKVMGVGTVNGGHAEPLFCWDLPETWCLEDAVTLPMAYVKAYYALLLRGKLNSRSKVLIHSGHSILGEACIALALNLDCEIFTSADTLSQANYIKKRFSKSNRLRVFMANDEHIDVKVLQLTRGKGVDIVVNAENERQIKQSTHCLNSYGTFVQIAERSIKKNIEIGMRIFANSVTAHSLTDLSIFKNHPEIKKEIQALVQEALQCDNFLRPFQRIVYNPSEELQINGMLKENDTSRSVVIKLNSNLNANENLFSCDPDKYYLIIGKKTEIWFSVINWLLENNARKLVLIEDDSLDSDYNVYQKRFHLLIENHPDLSLLRSSSSLLNSKEEAENTIQMINSAAPLDVAFFISLNNEEVSNVNAGLLKCAPHLRQLICLQCDASKVCESRHQCSLPALNVIWDRGIRDATLLTKSITGIVNNCLKINSPLIYIADSTQFAAEFDRSKVQKIVDFLPKFSEADYFEGEFSENPVFEKIVSKVSEYDPRTQLFPIFVIPGFRFKRLEALIKKLMYPVFYAKFSPKYSSARSIAQSLVKALKEIQPSGPYTIVGESWGGAIAMELTSLLEQNHEDQVRLILLEGIPKDLQEKLSTLGSFGSHEFLDNLCELCFGHKMSKASFEDGKSKADNEQMKYLELLQRRLTVVYHYTPTNVNLNSHIIAVKLEDNDVLNTYVNFEEHYGQNLDLKIMAEENYDNLMKSKVLATLINDNVLFKW